MDFRILGPLEVIADGRSYSIGSGKQRALLAILLLRANEPVATDTLLELLWGNGRPRHPERRCRRTSPGSAKPLELQTAGSSRGPTATCSGSRPVSLTSSASRHSPNKVAGRSRQTTRSAPPA